MGEKTYRTGDLAKRFKCTDNTIRNWARQYAEFLSLEGRGIEPGATREFGRQDAITLATVHFLKSKGYTPEMVEKELVRNFRVPELPELPNPDVEEAKDRMQLAPLSDVERWMDRAKNHEDQIKSLEDQIARSIQLYESEIKRLTEERDKVIDDWHADREASRERQEAAQKRISELEREAGRLEGELNSIKAQDERQQKRRGLFGR